MRLLSAFCPPSDVALTGIPNSDKDMAFDFQSRHMTQINRLRACA